MGAAHDDLRPLRRAAHLDDVGLQPCAGLGSLVGHLLGLGQQRLDLAQVEERVALVALLDDARDDVALAAGVLLVLALTLGLTDALAHDLLGRLRGDAPEVVGRVVARVDPVAFLVDVVGHHLDVTGEGVDLDLGLVARSGHALVGRCERVGERLQQNVDRDALLGGEELEGLHHVGVAGAHRAASFADSDSRRAVPLGAFGAVFFGLGAFGGAPHSKTVRARSISA